MTTQQNTLTADQRFLALGKEIPDLMPIPATLSFLQVRTAGSVLPIIVLSSRDDEEAKVASLDLGADDYVTKPFGMDELLARIRAAQRHRL